MRIHRARAWLEERRHYAAVFVRLLVGIHLIVETHDHLLSWEAFARFADLLASHGVPLSPAAAAISLASQAFAGVSFLLGAATRPAAALMVANFCVALVTVHAGHGYHEMFPALVMLSGALFLLVHGAGMPSVDALLSRRLFATRPGHAEAPRRGPEAPPG